MRRAALAAVLLALLGARDSQATTVVVQFSGTFTDSNFVDDTVFQGDLVFGDPITGTFTYESTAVDQDAFDTTHGVYPGFDFSATYGSGLSLSLAGAEGEIDDNTSPVFDKFEAASNVSGTLTGDDLPTSGMPLVSFSVQLSAQPTFLNSDGLPASFDFADWGFGSDEITIGFSTGSGTATAEFTVDSLSTVPEPSTALLMGVALVLVCRRGSR